MSETKKETTQDAVKQLGAYKPGKFAALKTAIASEKAKAVALMTAMRSRREALLAAEEEARRAEELRAEATEKEKAETEAPKAREKTCGIWKKVSLTAVTAVV